MASLTRTTRTSNAANTVQLYVDPNNTNKEGAVVGLTLDDGSGSLWDGKLKSNAGVTIGAVEIAAGQSISRNTIVASDGTAISWKASGGDYALTCTSVTNNNGRQGAKGDLTATRSRYYMARVTFSVGSAATAGNEIEVYWAASPNVTAGSENPGGTSGTDATFNTTPDEYKLQLQFIGSLVLSNNAGTGVQSQNLGPFIPRFRYGMPVIVNKSGQTMGSTAGDHTFTLYPWSEQA